MNKIFCLGDGFAHGHIWPEWPQILTALLPDYDVIPITGIGAGNEFLISGLLGQDIANSTVIFQWAIANRFDKLLRFHNDQWQEIIKNDPVYWFNVVEQNGVKWWLSSGSTSSEVKHYHDFYVTRRQAHHRLVNQQKLIEAYVNYHNCNYVKISTPEQDAYSFQMRFAGIRGKEIQPSPVVHYCYINEVILPKLNVTVDVDRKNKLENLIKNTKWIAYDPDQSTLWKNIVTQLDC
jgi:hypothetical protein